MKREIKFRAWDENKKGFHYWDSLTQPHNNIFWEIVKTESLDLDQYTGLRDKNGVDCFDGDIYKNGENGLIGVMEYAESLGGYILWAHEKKNGKTYTYRPFYEMDNTDVEIIGNIYQNPELIKS